MSGLKKKENKLRLISPALAAALRTPSFRHPKDTNQTVPRQALKKFFFLLAFRIILRIFMV